MLAVMINNEEGMAGGGNFKRHIFRLMLADAAAEKAMRDLSGCREQVCSALLAREALGSTCIAPGIAVVHARLDFIGRVYMAAGILAGPVCWDEEKNIVRIVFMLLVPKAIGSGEAEMVRSLMRRLADEEVCARLAEAGSPAGLCQALGF